MAYKQAGRLCILDTPLGKDVLILQSLNVVESVSALLTMQMELVSHETIAFDKIVGKSVTVDLQVGDGPKRYFNGIVARFAQGGTYQVGKEDLGLVRYHAEVVPWLWLLTRTTNCRVWEQKSAVQILEDVLGDPKYDGHAYEFASVGGTYDPIEYCVQYRETDFDFVSRLMEEEGLAYAFRHENGKHTTVIFDTSSGCPDCPGAETLQYSGSVSSTGNVKMVEEWDVAQALLPGKYALNGYDFTSPSDDLLAPTESAISVGGNAKFEIYDAPSYYTASAQGGRYAKLRMEAEEAASHEVRGRSVCGGLTAGTHIKLDSHYCDDFNKKRYLLTRVEHAVTESVGHGGAAAEASYENTFTCLPERIPYRPLQKTRRPRIAGTQTAVVVGPAGEEIHCDKYGRVRIQFHWDRNGPGDGTAVCWARVMQSIAGKKWGSIYIPRIGQEVVVSFLEGDPDRPLVTGVVYNAEQMPPYTLPDNKTQSGIKTRSSKIGDPETFNEIRFEDKKDNELLFIQAEKDLEEIVENDRNRNVGHDESVTIGRDQTVQVQRNRSDRVDKDEDRTVSENRTRTVGKNETVSVGEDQKLTIDRNRSVEIAKDDGLDVGANLAVAVEKNYGITVTKDYSLDAKRIAVEAKDEITLTTGKASIQMKKNGDITIKGKKITVKGSGDVIMKGSKIKQN